MKTFLVFDVESIGLHGQGYAVGYTVITQGGSVWEEGMFACDPSRAAGTASNRTWVEQNIPPLEITHDHPVDVNEAFYEVWMKWKKEGALLAADCLWPVEARFVMDMVRNLPEREWDGPYPFIDIGSVLLAKGVDPLMNFDRLHNEIPKHNPLCDARQSARILIEQLNS